MTDPMHSGATGEETLESLLRAEYTTLKALAQAIDDEHEVLLGNDPEALEAVTARKRRAAEAHGEQQRRRLNWMRMRDLPADVRLSELAAVKEGPEALRQVQGELATLAQDCFERNRRNGALITRLQDRARGALDVLRREESRDLYSLSGAREHSSDSRSLGKA